MSGITIACSEFHDATDGRSVTGSCFSAKDSPTGEESADETVAICQVVCLLVPDVKEAKCGAEEMVPLTCLIASHAFCDTRPKENSSIHVHVH